MDSSEIKINETHICVLKEKNRLIYPENIKLKYKFKADFEEFEKMCSDDNYNLLAIERFLQNSNLSTLAESFDFCKKLSSRWEGGINSYEFTKYEDYKKEIEGFKRKLKNNLDEEKFYIDEEIEQYHKKLKDKLLKDFTIRKQAYTLKEAYKTLKLDKMTLAFSHRKVGWTYPEFKLGTEFTVIFKTNFGYGSSSYFFTNIRYKGIDILPYSDWIKYKFVDAHEVVRYTKKNALKNEHWLLTMNFTSELYNASVINPSSFVKKWILNECIEMVEGLENLFYIKRKHKISYNSYTQNIMCTLSGIELVKFKGERISGALGFLDKISELLFFSKKISSFIERILKCNIQIYPELQIEITKLDKSINITYGFINEIEPQYTQLKTAVNNFLQLLQKKVDVLKENMPNIQSKELKTFKDKFDNENPDFKILKEKFKPICDKYIKLEKQLLNQIKWRDLFLEYTTVIETHFKKIDRPLELGK